MKTGMFKRDRASMRKVIVSALLIFSIIGVTLAAFYDGYGKTETSGWEGLAESARVADGMVSEMFLENQSSLQNMVISPTLHADIRNGSVVANLKNTRVGKMQMKLRIYFANGDVATEQGMLQPEDGIELYKERMKILNSGPVDSVHTTTIRRDWLDRGVNVVEQLMLIESKGEVVGIMAGIIDLAEVSRNLTMDLYGGRAVFIVVDTRDQYVVFDSFHKADQSLRSFCTKKLVDGYSAEAFVKKILEGEAARLSFISNQTGEENYLYMMPSVTPNYATGIYLDGDDVFAGQKIVSNMFFLIFGCEFLLFIGYLVWLFRLTNSEIKERLQEEQLATENELKRTQALLGSLHSLMDNLLTIYYVNPYTGEIKYTMMSEEEVIGIRPKMYSMRNTYTDLIPAIDDLIYEPDRERCRRCYGRENLIRIYESGQSATVDLRWNAPDGYAWIRNKMIRMETEGQDQRLIISVENITKEKEEELKRTQQTNELMQNFMKEYDRVYIVDLDANVYRSMRQQENQELEERYGDAYEDAIKGFVEQNVLSSDRALVLRELSARRIKWRLKNTPSYNVLYREEHEGQLCWYELRISIMDNGRDVLLGMADRHSDIVAKQVFKHLKEDYSAVYYISLRDNRLHTAFPSKVWDNPTTETGETADYRTCVMTYASKLLPEYARTWEKLADVEYLRKILTESERFEYEFLAFDNVWRRATFRVMERYEGVPEAVTLTYMNLDRDSVERIQLNQKIAKQKELLEVQQEELLEARHQAVQASEAKTLFLFNMSHDIRTPMNAILGFTAMGKKYIKDTARAMECLEKIDVSGQQLLSLVNQVLEMSRIESGKVVLQEKNADMIERAKTMMTIISVNAKVKNIELHCNVKNIKHKDVVTDVDRVNQVILNILGNSVKYTLEGGRIDFSVEEIEIEEGLSKYVMTTTDTGIGMSKEFLEHIYDAFSRENTSTVNGIQGTGLGMPIVKRLVELLGGTIEIESEQGVGTMVKVTVPMRWIEEAETEETAIEEISEGRFAGKKLLLVEDNEMNREIAVDILEDYGFLVEEAEDGDIAVEKIKNAEAGYYDCVLMDVQMPRMNGYDATKAIRSLADKEKASVPILAMTANAFAEDRQKALEAGMNDHLAKPIDVTKLLQTLVKFAK